jgi:hypothetical protein
MTTSAKAILNIAFFEIHRRHDFALRVHWQAWQSACWSPGMAKLVAAYVTGRKMLNHQHRSRMLPPCTVFGLAA